MKMRIRSNQTIAILTLLLCVISLASTPTKAQAKELPLFVDAVDYSKIPLIADCEETLYRGKPRKYSRCVNPDKLFETAKSFALDNKMPLVILWGFDACPACENLERVFFDPEMLPSNKAVSELLTSKQKEQFLEYTDGTNQLALVRINSGTSIKQNQVFADKIGANQIAGTLGSFKVWSPMFMVVNPKTNALASNSYFNGYSYCNFGEELAQGLELVGVVKDDVNWDKSCYMPGDYSEVETSNWESECVAGDYKKCFWTGSIYARTYYDLSEDDENNAEKFRSLAESTLVKACDNGLVTACRSVAYILPREKEEYSEKAMSFFRRACNQRDMKACGQIAYGYQYGEGGLQKFLPKAAMFYAKVCDSHYPWACSKLGEMAFYRDPGTTKYRSKAKQLIAFGCRDEIDWACKEKFR